MPQENLHPTVQPCSSKCTNCGELFTLTVTLSKLPETMLFEFCSKCHPAYIEGGNKTNRKSSAIDRFNERLSRRRSQA